MVKSDHNPMICKFNIQYVRKPKKLKRRELFNLKNEECQTNFFNTTNSSLELQKCFTNNGNLEEESQRFFNTFDNILHKCFSKIRIRNCARRSDVSQLIEAKSHLSSSLGTVNCKLAQEIIAAEISRLEDDIAKLSAHRNAKKVKEYVRNLDSASGNFSQLGLWRLKRDLCQTQPEPPSAKIDKKGTLISSPNLLRKLYLETYTERLRNREMKPELKELYFLKCELWELRKEKLKASKSKLWTLSDLEKVLKKLKTNKTRDPHGLINDIFKPGVKGQDLKLAMLKLFNSIKAELKIPKMLQFANITTIWKKKGSRRDLENDRGIFVVSVMRMILDSLIYEDKYNDIDDNMSDSNIGARKNRNVRDHLFIVNGIINSVLNGESPPIDIQIYDVQKCFDALWLEDCMLDIFETLPAQSRDDKIALLYEMNKENFVAVKTAVGLTTRKMMPKIVMQGGKWGPLKCSNTMDRIGKECVKKGKNLYKYKGKVNIMPLAMIDDLLGIN